MDKIVKFVTKHPLLTIVIILVVTLNTGIACFTLRTESDIKKLLPESSLSVSAYNEIDEKFGGADRLFIILEDKNIFDHDTLSKIRKLTNELENISGVSRATSITDIDEIKSVPEGIGVVPLIDEIPKESNKLGEFKKKLLSDDKYSGIFVSKDASATLILAKLYLERDENTVKEIRSLAKSFEGPEKIFLTGSPYVAQAILEGIARDMLRLIPLVIILVSVVLYFGFRNWYGVILPLVSVIISTIWSLGTMALYGKPITVVSSAIPVLLISIGSAYGIHLMARFEEEEKYASKQQILERAMSKTGIAIFIAAATTAVAFASNMVSDISAIRTFGVTAAFGILSAFAITITFIPAVYSLIRINKIDGDERDKKNGSLSRVLTFLSNIITTKKLWILIPVAALLLLAAVSYPRLSTETDPVRYFSKKSEVIKSAELIKEKFGGAVTLDILLKGDLKDPALLRKVEQLQHRLENIELLGKPYSIVDALKETNRLMHDDQEKFEVIPHSREGIAQSLLLLSMTGGDFLENLITYDNEEMLISSRVKTTRSNKIDKMIKEVNKAVQEVFADQEIEIKLSGMSVILKDMRDMLILNQIQSLALALLFVFIMIFVIYRSLTGAIFCMTPIFITLLLNFGVMGWFKIHLDMATVMVGSIAVGLGIDYSVHLFNRYKEERLLGKEREQSISVALKRVGKPIIYNAASVALGFLVLLFSNFALLKNFGVLVALTMLFSSLGALVILPELLMLRVNLINLYSAKKAKSEGENKQ